MQPPAGITDMLAGMGMIRRELVRGHPSKFVLYLSGAGNGPLKPSSAQSTLT